ncbi:RNHCP domain-containing protein [bacterium]|nr:RNHCP domain-containing protein [bacterium]
MINEGFICDNCGKTVDRHPEGSARNHCPFCLHSKHMDEKFP